eukprot:6173567-Pleurochrysis_carterae.AAC.3
MHAAHLVEHKGRETCVDRHVMQLTAVLALGANTPTSVTARAGTARQWSGTQSRDHDITN